MKIQIKSRWNASIIFEAEVSRIKDAVEKAVKEKANLRDSDLGDSDLRGSDLRGSDLRGSNLRGSDLRGSNLRGSDLSGSNLRGSNLRDSNLRGSDLRGSDLSGSDLRGSDLRDSNLSGTNGIMLPSQYLAQFDHDNMGIIVYRAQRGCNNPPANWKFAPGEFLTETPNPDRGTECGCGVNFATLYWVNKNHPEKPIWKCRIHWPDIADVVVPFNTDGKARCARLELIEIVKG